MATTSTKASEAVTTSWLITYISMLWIVLTRGTRSLVKQVTLEFIPKEYKIITGDKSAMDAIVRYYNTDEKECFIAVETKYSESLGTNEAKDESTKRQERDVAVSLGVFTKEAEERIASGRIPLTQIYRNFLLSEAYGRREGLESYSIILAPSIHPSTSAEVASLYPELKEEHRDKLPLIRNLLQICNKFRRV